MKTPTVSSEKASLEPTPADKTAQSVDDQEELAAKNYQPKTLKFWTILISVYLSVLLVLIDRTIIATAIPRITDRFNSIGDIGWYGSAYMLASSCVLPISGRIYQLYSTKSLFIIFLIIFEAGSALCGASPSSVAFILGRALAGLGSAGVFSGSMVMMLPLIPLSKRPVFNSLLGLISGLASVIGPVVGGILTDKVTWRWCFYINLPIGAVTIIALFFLLDIPPPKHEKLTIIAQIKNVDPIGIIFFVPSMVCLILALQWGGTTYSWSSPKIIGLFVAFALLLVIFVIIEVAIPKTAIAPTRVILNRSVAGSMVFMLLISGAMMSILYYLTIWFQVTKNDSALKSGVSTIPLLLSMIVMSIPVAVFIQKVGYYVPALLLSPVFAATGAGLLSTLTPSSGHSKWIGFQVLFGFGLGCGFQTSTLGPQTVLPSADVPIGLALVFFMQQIGGSIFLPVSQSIFSGRLVDRLSGIAGLDAETILNTGAINLHSIVPTSEINAVVEAYNYSLTGVFLMTAALSACTILAALPMEWRSIKNKKGQESTPNTEGVKLEEEKIQA